MYIKLYGEVREEDVRAILEDIKNRTQAESVEDAIVLAFHDEDYFSRNKYKLKLIKMLYSMCMDAISPVDVISLYAAI